MRVRRKGLYIKHVAKRDLSSFNKGTGFKSIKCKICKKIVEKCSSEAESVICPMCVQKMIDPPKGFLPKKPGDIKPRGWKFMKIFVDSEKNVFYRGIEQPDLKGTLEPTKIVPKPKKKKLTPREKEKNEIERNHIFFEINVLKKQLTSLDLNHKQRRKLEKEISMNEKKIKKIKL